jgi:hypothetical protein
LSLGVILLLGLGALALRRPSNSREWIADHARIPTSELQGERVHIEGIRDFRYVTAGSVHQDYYDATFTLSKIASLWFVLSIFHEENFRGPAHSMLSFGFADGSYVAISVEARKEVGESYSIYQGLLKRYELIYVIGDERDLVRTRSVFRPDDVYVYPVRTRKAKIRELFVDMLRSANSLHEKPQFYNTAFHNCTTVLRDHVNAVAPGRMPHSWKVLLPGYSDELLESLGLLDSDLTVEQARQRYWINERARRFVDADDFSARIRAD